MFTSHVWVWSMDMTHLSSFSHVLSLLFFPPFPFLLKNIYSPLFHFYLVSTCLQDKKFTFLLGNGYMHITQRGSFSNPLAPSALPQSLNPPSPFSLLLSLFLLHFMTYSIYIHCGIWYLSVVYLNAFTSLPTISVLPCDSWTPFHLWEIYHLVSVF